MRRNKRSPSPECAFKWRHCFLKAQNHSKDQPLAGIAEADEIFLLESFKGRRKLPRTASREFAGEVLTFLREKVPQNWADLCDSVTDNFRVINPKDFRVLA